MVTRLRTPQKRPSTFDEQFPGSISGNLSDELPLTSGVTVAETKNVAGAARIRIRWLATCDGQLQVRFLRSITNREVEYQTIQPANAATIANIETVVDIPEHMGEGRLLLRFIPSADGVLDYCDVVIT